LYAGKLDENKNVALLAAAFHAAGLPKTHLIIAGNGVMEDTLKKDYGKTGYIHFLPFKNQSEMPLLYGMADIYVLPSLSETWGLAINEAMACGRAVLVSDACGAAEDLVKNGINGYTFLSNDAGDIEKKIKMLAEDKNAVTEMGQMSYNIIKSWSYEHACLALETLINNGNENSRS
jgi:glycosyltransferase involved in cell wall biosynthesis